MPLFDRLVDDEPEISREPVPQRTLDRAGLHASIERELARVLETRCPFPGDVALDRERSALDYGLPDLDQGGRGHASERRARLVRLITHTIEAFEPRLADVRVTILDTGEGRSRVTVALTASVLVGDQAEPLRLSLPLGGPAS
jgi:type VI secretion system protein ImpF